MYVSSIIKEYFKASILATYIAYNNHFHIPTEKMKIHLGASAVDVHPFVLAYRTGKKSYWCNQ